MLKLHQPCTVWGILLLTHTGPDKGTRIVSLSKGKHIKIRTCNLCPNTITGRNISCWTGDCSPVCMKVGEGMGRRGG